MHWGTGALVGALRGVWAVVGLRGPEAHVAHTIVRLATDQTIENATGVGAPPSTWPRSERVIDCAHKAIYAVVTGVVAERMITPRLASTAGRRSH
jgi:alkylhydroperoxidase/carboxymuconolactone decarboxylase family protein YurZ